MTIEFKEWPKTPRLNRDIVITEKIDGTNSAVIIEKDVWVNPGLLTEYGAVASFELGDTVYTVAAQSRNRLIFPGKTTDNYNFAAWVRQNAQELAEDLGPGRHYGEWWGQGVARRYGMDQKVFSLFNVERYAHLAGYREGLRLVPELYRGPFSQQAINDSVYRLRNHGSVAAPGFERPEGVIVFHSAAQQVFKVTLENDEVPKALAA